VKNNRELQTHLCRAFCLIICIVILLTYLPLHMQRTFWQYHRQHKYYLRLHYDSRPLPGFRVYLDSGRVLEKKPVNQMECGVHYISTKTN